jgi:hypothetical protein
MTFASGYTGWAALRRTQPSATSRLPNSLAIRRLGYLGEQRRLMNPEIAGNAHGPGIDGTGLVRSPKGKASVDNGSGTW